MHVLRYCPPCMVSNMKTTIDIPDALLEEAREVARREQTTLRELVETGLRGALTGRHQAADFRLRDARVDGRGLQAGFRGATGAEILEAAYGDSQP